jgi:hypothetical protein
VTTKDDDNGDPPTIPPDRFSTPSPDIEIRESNPDELVLRNAAPHIQLTIKELRETRALINQRELAAIERERAEQKRADVRHEDATKLQTEFLKLETLIITVRKNSEKLDQLWKYVSATRKDIGALDTRLEIQESLTGDHQQRIAVIEAHIGIASNGPSSPRLSSDPPTEPPESADGE